MSNNQNLKQACQNLHSHTTYCDGRLTAEEMVKAAIERGGTSIGFSEHSFVFFEKDAYSMSLSETPKYIREVNSLREKYAGQIDIFLGMEQDYFTDNDTMPGGLDYIIGAVHHVELDGKYVTIDNSFEGLQQIRDKYFSGDIYAMTGHYYATIADIAEKTNADIIGHFDIIAKQNTDGRLFDEDDPRYVSAAIGAIEKILERCKIFEINSGAMYRKGNTVPYPSAFILRELSKRGGQIVFSSDSHDADSLYYKFGEMKELAASCGFKTYKYLTASGWIDIDISSGAIIHSAESAEDMRR